MHWRQKIPDEKENLGLDGLSSHTVLYARDEAPQDGSGIFYRERLIAVHPGSTQEEASHLIHAYFNHLKELGADSGDKLFISVQVYDHEFEEQADRPAIAALTWRQWKPKKPKILFPLTGDEGVTFSMLPPPPAAVESVEKMKKTSANEAEPIDLKSEIKVETKPMIDENPIELVHEKESGPSREPIELTSEIEVATKPAAKEIARKKDRAFIEEKIRTGEIALDDKMIAAFERIQEIYEVRDHDRAAAFVLSLARDLIDCEAGSCMLISPGKYELYVSAAEGPIANSTRGKALSLTRGIVGFATRSSSVINVSDAYSDPRFDREIDEKSGFKTRTIVCAPIQYEGRTRGAIELINSSRKGGFIEKEADILSYLGGALAEYISISLPSREADFSDKEFFEHLRADAALKKEKEKYQSTARQAQKGTSPKQSAESEDSEHKKKTNKKHRARGKRKKKQHH
jgi:hypothetical protein